MTLPSTNHSCVQPMCINHVFEICYTLKKKERNELEFVDTVKKNNHNRNIN